MFFSNELLSLRKGRFGVLWLAATRGLTRVNKRDILAVDVTSSCSELLDYVNGSKKSRLSLYLAAQLIKSRSKSCCDVDIEIPLASNDDFGSFNLLGQLVVPQSDFEISMPSLDNSFSFQARLEDITLIDTAMTPKTESGLLFGEDFQTELLSDLLGDGASASAEAVCSLFRDSSPSKVRRSVLNLSSDDKEKYGAFMSFMPFYIVECVLRTSFLMKTLWNFPTVDASAYGDRQFMGLKVLELLQQSRFNMMTVTHPSIFPPFSLRSNANAPQGTSPKRRRVDSAVDASDISVRNSSLDLEYPRPCAASSAVKSKPSQVTFGALHISQLSVRDVQVSPPRRRRRRRRRNCRLVIDEVLQLSKAEIMRNFETSHDGLRTRAEILAPAASEAHPRRARSFYVDRLLALPANWELAISRTLSELWRSKRRLCESMPLEDSHPFSSCASRSNLGSIRESVTESSREEARGTMSEQFSGLFAPRVSSLGLARASSSQDQEQEGRSLHAPVSTQSITIPEEGMLPPSVEPPTIHETTLLAPEIPPPQLEEEKLESMTEVKRHFGGSVERPFFPLPLVLYSIFALLFFVSTIQKVSGSDESTVEFSRLLAPSTTRKQAAKAFHHLLCTRFSSILLPSFISCQRHECPFCGDF
ncbi:unnamed protein product [Hydatigera taeniaeformis]|uniref:Rad21_Rec8_N domain-containing protein n=1 Tax=Hydatigena taeniaeformis TaxID=6205 RepID=A0A0R3X3I6_HYDTA|nr:unnamed protein product [Hydatigera taeniaeformis]